MSTTIAGGGAVGAFQVSLFERLFASIAQEMGVTLQRSSFSPNIKERRDFSCAVFDRRGRIIAQAEHIPVHLGAMPMSVAAAIELFGRDEAAPGDLVILNDPYRGGTHLPDITTVSPIYVTGAEGPELFGYAATRAHHADVGGMSPGSMAIAREIFQEGLIIPPVKLVRGGSIDRGILDLIVANVRTPTEREGDLTAQLAAHRVAERRTGDIAARYGLERIMSISQELIEYSARLARARIARLPRGTYAFVDYLDDDGISPEPLPIRVSVRIDDEGMRFDFSGTSPQVTGSLNAPAAVARSAVYYVLRCIVGGDVPANDGLYGSVTIDVPPRSLLDPESPRPVAGGNVETSQRVVDAVWGALAQALPELVPAAGQGTMNNITLGGYDERRQAPFAYYETMGGGGGGGPKRAGAHGIHVAMSNTWNTPIEALEHALPVRVRRYSLRTASGGDGAHPGGMGMRRDIEVLTRTEVTLLGERRQRGPWGLAGGGPGKPGDNLVLRTDGWRKVGAKSTVVLEPGEVISLRSPGGGGWGRDPDADEAAPSGAGGDGRPGA